MASPFSPYHSPPSDHERLLHDFQGQEIDHERQEEERTLAKNDKISEDGRKKQDTHIYPKWLADRNREAYLEDIKIEHQDHHISTFDIGGTKKVSPYDYSPVPLLHLFEVRRLVYIRLILPLCSTSSSFCYSATLLNHFPPSVILLHKPFPSFRHFFVPPPSLLL